MKKVRCVPIVSVRLTSSGGTTKIVSSCEGAISWWSQYQSSWWFDKIKPANLYDLPRDEYLKITDKMYQRRDRYARRCRPIFERVFGVK